MNTKPLPPPELTECGPAVTDADVATLERFLGTRLPVAYRAFLARYNGGKPIKPTFQVPTHPEGSLELELFFGLTRDEGTANLEWNYRTHRTALGKNLLPIGRTATNDLLALGLTGDKRDWVLFYDAIEEEPSAKLHTVSEGFAAFMASLTPESVDD